MNEIDPALTSRSAADLLKAMANEHRLAILCRLAMGEASAGELTASAGLSQSALSQHLARLRAEGLVTTRRASQQIFYALASVEAQRLLETLHSIYCASDVPHPPTVPEEVSR